MRRRAPQAHPHGDRFGQAADQKFWTDTVGFESTCIDIDDLDQSETHLNNHALQKDNFPEPFYTLELSLNLVELNSAYPKEPQTLGEHIRKARMDRRLMIKELAAVVGVSPDTIINWELRNVKPTGERLKRVREVLGI